MTVALYQAPHLGKKERKIGLPKKENKKIGERSERSLEVFDPVFLPFSPTTESGASFSKVPLTFRAQKVVSCSVVFAFKIKVSIILKIIQCNC